MLFSREKYLKIIDIDQYKLQKKTLLKQQCLNLGGNARSNRCHIHRLLSSLDPKQEKLSVKQFTFSIR